MKRYTDDELLRMTEDQICSLNNHDSIDDDDWMRWYVLQDELQYIAEQFIRTELKYL